MKHVHTIIRDAQLSQASPKRSGKVLAEKQGVQSKKAIREFAEEYLSAYEGPHHGVTEGSKWEPVGGFAKVLAFPEWLTDGGLTRRDVHVTEKHNLLWTGPQGPAGEPLHHGACAREYIRSILPPSLVMREPFIGTPCYCEIDTNPEVLNEFRRDNP